MKNADRPYFLWDYDLTQDDVRRILRGKNETEKIWMMGRILSHAHFRDVWEYLTVKDIVSEFPKLRMRPEIKKMWQKSMHVWGYHV